MGVLAIVLSLVLLIYFAYRGVSVLILAPLLSLLAVLISGEVPLLSALSYTYMPAVAGYLQSYFPVFLAGAIFGKLMGVSGASIAIAKVISDKLGTKYAIASTVLATALLTYGGVSLFVVVFAMYPIGSALFKEADIPKRMLPGAIALGAFTFTMTAMPGSPQFINSMPTSYFGTTTWAAPTLGIIGSIIICGLGLAYLGWEQKRLQAAGEGYGEDNETIQQADDKDLPPFWAAILPILVVFAVNFYFTFVYFANEKVVAHYDQYADMGPINKGVWPVVIGLTVAAVLSIFLYRKQLKDLNKTLFEGANGALLPIFNTASEVGYGGVIKSLSAFGTAQAAITGLAIPGLFKVAIVTTLLAGVVGSSSGGTAIALAALSEEFLSYGINPEVLHRVMIMAAGGLDTFPHSGAVVTLLAVTHVTPRQGYRFICVNTMIIPLIATFAIIILHMLFGIV